MSFKLFKLNILLVSIIFLLISCSNISKNNVNRVNPTPPNPSLFDDLKDKDTKSTPTPEPIFTPVPTPTLNLSEYNFEVKISFDGVLPRVQVDNGEIREIPATYKLQGGEHEIIVFDLITKCWIGKKYLIDKDMLLEIKYQDQCE